MFKEISINGYRGLKDIELNGLRHINVIVGANNSGKTSILEAIQLFDRSDVVSNMVSIAKRRENQSMALSRSGGLLPFEMFLYSFDMHDEVKEICLKADTYKYEVCTVKVTGKYGKKFCYTDDLSASEAARYKKYADEDGYIRTLTGEYSYKMDGTIKKKYQFRETLFKPLLLKNNMDWGMNVKYEDIVYISPVDMYTSRIITASLYKGMLIEEKKRLIELLKLFDDRIINIENTMRHGHPEVCIELQDCGLVPLSIFGEGLKKVLTLASAVVKARNGVILIDEFETGIHKRALIKVAEWLAAVTEKYHVQVFLTTHSSDAIEALVEADKDRKDVKAYRLEHYRGNIYVKEFEGYDLHRFGKYQGLDIL